MCKIWPFNQGDYFSSITKKHLCSELKIDRCRCDTVQQYSRNQPAFLPGLCGHKKPTDLQNKCQQVKTAAGWTDTHLTQCLRRVWDHLHLSMKKSGSKGFSYKSGLSWDLHHTVCLSKIISQKSENGRTVTQTELNPSWQVEVHRAVLLFRQQSAHIRLK